MVFAILMGGKLRETDKANALGLFSYGADHASPAGLIELDMHI